MPIIKCPVWVGADVYKICPKCNERHWGSCAHCAWEGTMPNGCYIGVGVYPDGSFTKEPLQVIPKKVTTSNFFTVCQWWNVMYFPSEEAANKALVEYMNIRRIKDNKERYPRFIEWYFRDNPDHSSNFEILKEE